MVPPMPESVLPIAIAQIMAEGGAKHSLFNCNIDSAAKKQKAERLANAEQLRADDLRNDPQKCQKTPQMTQVVNTNHQMLKSL